MDCGPRPVMTVDTEDEQRWETAWVPLRPVFDDEFTLAGDGEARQKRRESDRRALALLKRYLTPAQRRELRRFGYIHVKGSVGGRYRLDIRGGSGNVVELSRTGWPRRKGWCIYAAGDVPAADQVLAQKLLLETDEEGFKRVAYPYGRPEQHGYFGGAPVRAVMWDDYLDRARGVLFEPIPRAYVVNRPNTDADTPAHR